MFHSDLVDAHFMQSLKNTHPSYMKEELIDRNANANDAEERIERICQRLYRHPVLNASNALQLQNTVIANWFPVAVLTMNSYILYKIVFRFQHE